METALDRSKQPDPATNDLVKCIRKLRWMGMEEEAKRLQAELTRRSGAEGDSVIATPRETD
jgi:hypothetical protein